MRLVFLYGPPAAGKLTIARGAVPALGRWDFATDIPGSDSLVVDSSALKPAESARRILRAFRLPKAPRLGA